MQYNAATSNLPTSPLLPRSVLVDGGAVLLPDELEEEDVENEDEHADG